MVIPGMYKRVVYTTTTGKKFLLYSKPTERGRKWDFSCADIHLKEITKFNNGQGDSKFDNFVKFVPGELVSW